MNENIKGNVLVTGATGFIGSYLCKELLRKGHCVFGITRSEHDELIKPILNFKDFTLFKGDIRNINFLINIIRNNKIKTIFHLAAKLPHNDSLGDPYFFFNNNALGTLNLLNVASQNGVKKFIYGSTMSVYSEPPFYLPVDESHPVQPSTIYGVSKLEGELYCNIYKKEMNVQILRYSGVYGLGQHKHNAVFKFFTQALNNSTITIYGNGLQTTDFIYIDDVIDVTYLTFLHNNSGILNIGSGEETSIRKLAKKIVQITNSKSEIIFSHSETNRPFRFVYDIKKARQQLNYSPTSLHDGLNKYLSIINNMTIATK